MKVGESCEGTQTAQQEQRSSTPIAADIATSGPRVRSLSVDRRCSVSARLCAARDGIMADARSNVSEHVTLHLDISLPIRAPSPAPPPSQAYTSPPSTTPFLLYATRNLTTPKVLDQLLLCVGLAGWG